MQQTNCKLYRKLEEVFHPSISRENISNYKIILQNDLIPVGIFYPKKEVPLNRMMIYITDQKNNRGKDLAIYTNHLVFVLEKAGKDFMNQCYLMIKYLYNQMEYFCISSDCITIMSDINSNLFNKMMSKGRKTKDFLSFKEIYCGHRKKIKMEPNRLYLPSLDFPYHFYSEKQIYELINAFLIKTS